MTAHIHISGFVQGVGFRQFVKKEAQNLKLKGWVRNLTDNRVEIFVAGSKGNIEKLIKLCEKGPFLAQVKDVTVNFLEENKQEKIEDFIIL